MNCIFITLKVKVKRGEVLSGATTFDMALPYQKPALPGRDILFAIGSDSTEIHFSSISAHEKSSLSSLFLTHKTQISNDERPSNNHNNHIQEPKLSAMMNQQRKVLCCR